MVKVKKDLTGKNFGRLTVLYQTDDYVKPNGKTESMWHCRCKCGNELDIIGYCLNNGHTQSCGCLLKDILVQRNKLGHENKYDLSGDFGVGYSNNTNQPFYFDLEDYDIIKNYTWCEDKDGYIVTNKDGGTRRLHRIIMNCNLSLQVDHINHNTYDNRKENLRICTSQQNNFNKGLSKRNKSGTTGVWWSKDKHKWHSYITINGKRKHLGYFANIQDAINIRKNAEIEYFGEYRYNN